MTMKKNTKHPTREECFSLLKQYGTPEHVIRHCNMVALTAVTIAEALNEKGYRLDTDLIMGAGLLHDVARVEENHQDVGACFVSGLGYEEEAEIISKHMHYTADPQKPIDETALVCIADKMVMEDQYAGIDKRMEAIIQKFKDREGTEARIRSKLLDNKIFVDKVEHIIGMSMDQLMRARLKGGY